MNSGVTVRGHDEYLCLRRSAPAKILSVNNYNSLTHSYHYPGKAPQAALLTHGHWHDVTSAKNEFGLATRRNAS